MNRDELFMQRCFELARLGAGRVSPNPPVGAVLVYEDRIIGEGYHERYGQAHAEVNAVSSVAPPDQRFLPQSTLYVSLEPCCIYGKTPPCTNLILEKKIPRVVIACTDQSPEVNGQGVRILQKAGVEVRLGILEAEGRHLIRFRHTLVTEQRPYVILKFARTAGGYFAPTEPRQFWITHTLSKRLTHRWRSETDAILIGSHTARIDDPQLSNRYYWGASPRRIVLDRHGILPAHLHLFDSSAPTIVVTERHGQPTPGLEYLRLSFTSEDFLRELLRALAERHISSLIIEGGAKVLQSFLRQGLWDEARVFVGDRELPGGIPAPSLPLPPARRYRIGSDQLLVYYRQELPKALNFL